MPASPRRPSAPAARALAALARALLALAALAPASLAFAWLWLAPLARADVTSPGASAREGGPAAGVPTAPVVPSAPSRLSARVEPDPVLFGQPFHLVIELVRPEGAPVSLPDELPEAAATPRAGDVVRGVTPAGEGSVRETFRVPYLALDLEELKTPEVVLKTAAGEPLAIPPLPVNVEDGALADGGAADPESGLVLEEGAGPIVYRVFDPRPLVGLFTFTLSVAALFVHRRLSGRRLALPALQEGVSPLLPARAAHEVALERLEALLQEGLLARGEVALFVARLMDEVLRHYLEERYGVAAGRRTTRELAEVLLGVSAPGLDLGSTRALLERADLVKFARADVAAEVAHEMAGRVRALIEATRAQEALEAEEET